MQEASIESLSSGCGCICSLDMRIMSTLKRLVLIFFMWLEGILSSISFPLLLGGRGCFGMLTFSHDTHIERQVSKDGNTHFTCVFLWYPHKTKQPQKLEHVKCLVESSAAGFTWIRPALNRRPYSSKGDGLRLYSTHRNHQKPEGRPIECAIPYTVSAFAKKKPTFDILCNLWVSYIPHNSMQNKKRT